MTSMVIAFLKKLGTYIAIVVGALGALSGSVAAIQWGIGAVGLVPLGLVGTFVLGCMLTAAVIHARGAGAMSGAATSRLGRRSRRPGCRTVAGKSAGKFSAMRGSSQPFRAAIDLGAAARRRRPEKPATAGIP
jgi:hypothetical protein